MASLDGDCAALLASQSLTPIAQLNPDLPDQSSRAVRGEVTITWPYSAVTQTVAFLLAEPDVRLRRAKGQVRIELRGPSAKSVSQLGIGAGDELLLSLDGAEWAKDESPGRIPGARVDWQLRFSERLVLQVKSAESSDLRSITIDRPAADPAADSAAEPVPEARATTPDTVPAVPDVQSAVRTIPGFPTNEYPSPAFVKRARLSYGALFEGGFDIFEEDGGIKGKGRKRSRFGRDSGAWRYTSQSPSPEPASPARDEVDEDVSSPAKPSPRPQVMDEGCQTVEVTMAEAVSEPIDSGKPTSPPREAALLPESLSPSPRDHVSSPRENVAPVEFSGEEGVRSVDRSRVPVSQEESRQTTQASTPQERPKRPSYREETVQETETKQPQPGPSSAKYTETSANSLFGTSKASISNLSMFGTGAPTRVESAISIADQVRFGFSHTPQTAHSPDRPQNEDTFPGLDHDKHEAYPVSYLDDKPAPSTYANIPTYPDAADRQVEMTNQNRQLVPELPAVEQFGQARWEMSTQSQHYNPNEGGHFGTDALDEGPRFATGQASHPTEQVAPGAVPTGFASYGHTELSEGFPEGSPRRAASSVTENLAENEETISGEEVGVEDEEDEDAEYDEDTYGERIEQGDYDQRNHDIPSDDEEGFSEEGDEIRHEAMDGYGDEEMYDEDGEGEYWDEDEEDYNESEEDEDEDGYDMGGKPQPRRNPTASAPPGEPVVISLLSDSEDDDGPSPAPDKPSVASQTTPIQHHPKPAADREVSAEAIPQPRTDVSGPEMSGAASPGGGDRQLPSTVFGQTQVVDFGMRPNEIAPKPEAPAADMDSGLGTSFPTSRDSASFKAPDAHTYSQVVDIESAPSEASSEGLFVKQPRVEYLEPEDERINDSSSHESGEGNEAADKDGEGGPRPNLEDEQISVEEVSEDEKIPHQTVKAHGSGDSLSDDDSSSFESQVEEMSQRPEMVEDEDFMEGDDVDMIDVASAHSGPISQETLPHQALQQEDARGTPEAASSLVVEAVSTVVDSTTVAGGSLLDVPGIHHPEEKAPTAWNEGKTGAAEPVNGPSESIPSDQDDASSPKPVSRPTQPVGSLVAGQHKPFPQESPSQPHPVSRKAQDALISHDQLADGAKPYSHGLEQQAGVDAESHEEPTVQEQILPTDSHPQSPREELPEPSIKGTTEGVHATLPKSQPGLEDGQTLNGDVISGTQEVRRSGPGVVSELGEEDKVIPDSSLPTQHPNVDINGPKGLNDVTMPERPTQEEQHLQHVDIPKRQLQTGSSSPDISVHLAQQAVAARRSKRVQEPKKAPEPLRTSPRLTRARSNSLQTNTSPEGGEAGDNSVSLARAALASPSRVGSSTTTTSATALKSELTKRLRTDLPECVPLKSLRNHNEKFPNVVAVVTTQPTPATRAKGGPREYFMSFHVTDPSAAPATVVEVQLYRPHKESLPVVKPGDAVLLQRFQVKALSKKGFGLRTQGESAWAVFEEHGGGGDDDDDDDDGDGSAEGKKGHGAPQIRGPPVEDYEAYAGYAALLKRWFRALMADAAVRAKLEKADRKLAEAGGAGAGK